MFALNTGFPTGDYHIIRFNPAANEVRVARRRYKPIAYPAEVGPKGDFRIQYWDGAASVWLDDKWVFTDVLPLPERTWHPGIQLGIGGHYWFRDNGVNFKNLKVRLLEEPPTEIERLLRDRR